MPRVKIDYVVSFSSEDSENTASNLLANEVSKKKWLCTKGETSGSIVLQLIKTVQISAVHIGAYHAALVEVLVGRSETPNEPYKVLVPSCIFLSPTDSRKGEGVERVRSFSVDQLATNARDEKWDRVRVVCSQPYNKHCKFGISFIHLFEPEGAIISAPTVTQKVVPNQLLFPDSKSSDEDDCFKPGELFSKYMQNKTSGSSNTDTQIRQATSQAIKNISDSSTKLIKTPITKEKPNPLYSNKINDDKIVDRQRNNLMYDKEDVEPNDKIDKIVQRHNDEKRKKDTSSDKGTNKVIDTPKHSNDKNDSDKFSFALESEKASKNKDSNSSRRSEKHRSSQSHKKEKDRNGRSRDSHSRDDKHSKKRPHSADSSEHKSKRLKAGPISSSPQELLVGVVFVLSGYENPRRGALRDCGLALGARYSRDWDASCTHLICAFPNTPKLRTVRASPNGSTAIVVTGEWLEECCRRRRSLPWQWFATEPKYRVERPSSDGDDEGKVGDDNGMIICAFPNTPKLRTVRASPNGSTAIVVTGEWLEECCRRRRSLPWQWFATEPKYRVERPSSDGDDEGKVGDDNDCDTDDEIEKVLKRKEKQKNRESENSKIESDSKDPSTTSDDVINGSQNSSKSDVAFVKDERMQGNVTITDSEGENTEEEERVECEEKIHESKCLPDFFEGCTFVVDKGVVDAGFDKELLKRYIRAYGGESLELSQLDEDSEVNYIICASASCEAMKRARATQTLRADWLWQCHTKRKLCSTSKYVIA